MNEKEKSLQEQFNELMKGFNPKWTSGEWLMENGIYKQYSAFETESTSIGGTSYSF